MLGVNGEYPAAHLKVNFCCSLAKNCKKSAVKHSIDKPILLKFINLSPTPSPRLSEGTYLHPQLSSDSSILCSLKILALEKANSLLKLGFKATQF